MRFRVLPSSGWSQIIFSSLLLSLALPAPPGAAERDSRAYLAGWQEPPWQKDVSAARRLEAEGNKEAAIRNWEKAVVKGFQGEEIFLRLGRYFYREEDWDQAIKYLGQAIPRLERKGPAGAERARVYTDLGEAYRKTGHSPEAYINFRKALRIEPESYRPLLGLSRIYLRRGELGAAAFNARRALAVRPESAPACRILGQVAQREDRPAEAAGFYRRVLEIAPEWWEVRVTLARIYYWELKDAARAERELSKAIRSSSSALPRAVLADIYLQTQDWPAARKKAEEALRLSPRDYLALVVRGQLYLREKEYQKAYEAFNRALQEKPGAARAEYGLGIYYLQRKNYKEAERLFRDVIRQLPHFASAYYNLGFVLRSRNRREEAITQLRRAIREDPASAPAQLALGSIYYETGEKERARIYFQNARALDPSAWEADYYLGRCFLELGRPDRARSYLLRAREVQEENPAIENQLALVYQRLGKREAARDAYLRALALDPHYLPALLNLAVLEDRLRKRGSSGELYRRALILRPGEISWGYEGEKGEFIRELVSGLDDYLSSGISYLSLYELIKTVYGEEPVFRDLIPLLRDRLESRPLDPQYAHLLGLSYQEVGEEGQAEKYFLQALRVNSDFAAAHYSLGQLYTRRKNYRRARRHLEAFLTLAPDSPLVPAVRVLLKETETDRPSPSPSF